MDDAHTLEAYGAALGTSCTRVRAIGPRELISHPYRPHPNQSLVFRRAIGSASAEYGANVKALALKLLTDTDSVFANTTLYAKRPLHILDMLAGPSLMLPPGHVWASFQKDLLFTELSFPSADFRNITLDGSGSFANELQVGQIAPEYWNYSPEQLSAYGQQFRNSLISGFQGLMGESLSEVAVVGFEPLQPYVAGQWWPSGIRVVVAVDFTMRDPTNIGHTPAQLSSILHGVRLHEVRAHHHNARLCLRAPSRRRYYSTHRHAKHTGAATGGRRALRAGVLRQRLLRAARTHDCGLAFP
jgi:hypothetical protein